MKFLRIVFGLFPLLLVAETPLGQIVDGAFADSFTR